MKRRLRMRKPDAYESGGLAKARNGADATVYNFTAGIHVHASVHTNITGYEKRDHFTLAHFCVMA